MKHLSLFLLASALFLNSCDQKPASPTDKGENPVTNTSNPEKMLPDPAPSTALTEADLEMANEEVPNEKGDFATVLEMYPAIELPTNFSHTFKTPSVYSKAPIGKKELKSISGKGMVELADLEEAFYGHRFAVNDEVVALISCVIGEVETRLVLHTHKTATGEFIAKETISMQSKALTYGYASRIRKGGDIYRNQMIQIQEGDAKYWDIDHEDIFKMGADGTLNKE